MKNMIGQRGRILGMAAAMALIGVGAAQAFGDVSEEQRAALEGSDTEETAEAEPLPEVSMWDGVFTADQAAEGRTIYAANCASCHGATARGGPGNPSLIGNTLNRKYADMPLSVFYDYMAMNMPAGRPGTLLPQQYADVLAFVLTAHGVEPGENTLTPDRALLDSIIIGPRPE